MPAPPQGAGVDLIDADEHVAGTHAAQKEGAVGHHLRLVVEEGHQPGGEENGEGGDDHRNAHGQEEGGAGALFSPLYLAGPQILSHKGGGGQPQRLDREDNELIQLAVGGPAGHAVQAKDIDIGLHKHIGEGGDGHLKGGGNPDPDNLP